MREILFRGKTTNGVWKYGYLFVQAEGTEYEELYILGYLDQRESIYDVGSYADPIIPETIGQYTGLTDKNGKKIFEGDILESPVKRVGQKLGHLLVMIDIRECKYAALYVGEYSVIGNVHDNPELVEDKS